jgi:hypothetical protein
MHKLEMPPFFDLNSQCNTDHFEPPFWLAAVLALQNIEDHLSKMMHLDD